MENNNLENTTNMMITNEPKKKGNKGLTILLILIILGLVGYIAYDKVLKDKFFTKEEPKKIEKKKDDNNKKDENEINTDKNEKYTDIKGILFDENTISNSVSKTLSVNGKNYELTYNSIDEEGNGFETITLKYNNKKIYEGAEPYGAAEYNIFTSNDGKQYIMLKMYSWGEDVYILNEDGDILKKLDTKVDNEQDEISCYTSFKNEGEIITVENGNVYYYKYNSIDSKKDYTVKMDKIRLGINNNTITENNAGQVTMQLVQCDY